MSETTTGQKGIVASGPKTQENANKVIRRPKTFLGLCKEHFPRMDKVLVSPGGIEYGPHPDEQNLRGWSNRNIKTMSAKDKFEMLGGYDESDRFKGWSGEDSDLVIRAIRKFMRPVVLRDRRFLRVVQHSDIERIRLTDFDDAKA